ncbi:MAG: T9SS type A sorting domain-containing protein [Bacteroidota bacterium]
MLCIVFSILTAGGKHTPGQTAPLLGFTPFPYSLSQIDSSQQFVYSKIASDANIIAHHFDDGIPWNEAYSNSEFPSSIVYDWNVRKSKTPAGHKIYVAVTPINLARTGLALYKNTSGGDQPLSSPWDTVSFSHPIVKTAFLNYCKAVITQLQPDYLAIGIEVNLLKINSPQKWDSYAELHSFVYTELKVLFPTLPIFVSFTGFDLAGYTSADRVEQMKVLSDMMPVSDYLGLSLHPQLSSFMTNDIPPMEVLDSILSMNLKPVAVCETSYPAQYSTLYGGSITLNGTQAKQSQYFMNLFVSCEKRKTEFIINFVVRDYDQLWQDIGSPDDLTVLWRDTGFYDEWGIPRDVLQVWKPKVTSVADKMNEKYSLDYRLAQNYPNPFNPTTTISYTLSADEHVALSVYSVLGTEIVVLVDEQQPAGNYSVKFNGTTLPGGVYFYTLNAEKKSYTRKMLLLK